jgi:hypothetical protein
MNGPSDLACFGAEARLRNCSSMLPRLIRMFWQHSIAACMLALALGGLGTTQPSAGPEGSLPGSDGLTHAAEHEDCGGERCPGELPSGECPPRCDFCACCPSTLHAVTSTQTIAGAPLTEWRMQPFASDRPAINVCDRIFRPPRSAFAA